MVTANKKVAAAAEAEERAGDAALSGTASPKD